MNILLVNAGSSSLGIALIRRHHARWREQEIQG
jgi:acetate kinase